MHTSNLANEEQLGMILSNTEDGVIRGFSKFCSHIFRMAYAVDLFSINTFRYISDVCFQRADNIVSGLLAFIGAV